MSDIKITSTESLPNTYSARENGRARYSDSALFERSGDTWPGPMNVAKKSASMLCQPRNDMKKPVSIAMSLAAFCAPTNLSASALCST